MSSVMIDCTGTRRVKVEDAGYKVGNLFTIKLDSVELTVDDTKTLQELRDAIDSVLSKYQLQEAV